MASPSISRGLVRFIVADNETGNRLDHLVASRLNGFSRTRINHFIRDGVIRVQGTIRKPGYRVTAGEVVSGEVYSPPSPDFTPAPVDFEVLHADASCLVINKPPGLVVHPAPGHHNETLAHGLLYRYPELADAGPDITRPGIVHRIDKDTSGLLLIARTRAAHEYFTGQFKSRAIHKVYLAFVFGNPKDESGRISLPISRHPVHRKKMAATTADQGRRAETLWQATERFDGITLMQFVIKTGRTHQIRVHSAAIGHQIVGDPTYGYKNPLKSFGLKPELVHLVSRIERQMLHARTLSFIHPETGQEMTIEAPLPHDMAVFHGELCKTLSAA